MAQLSLHRPSGTDEQQHIDPILQRHHNMFDYPEVSHQHSSLIKNRRDRLDAAPINEYVLIDVDRNSTVVDKSFNFEIDLLEHNSECDSWEVQCVTALRNPDQPLPACEEAFQDLLSASQSSHTSMGYDFNWTSDGPIHTEGVEAMLLDLDLDDISFIMTESSLHRGIVPAAIDNDINAGSLVAREMFACIGAWTDG